MVAFTTQMICNFNHNIVLQLILDTILDTCIYIYLYIVSNNVLRTIII